MHEDRVIQLRNMALAIIQPDGVLLPVGEGKVKRFLGDRLAITLKAPTEKVYTLTIWNDMEQVLCVGWFDGDTPASFVMKLGNGSGS